MIWCKKGSLIEAIDKDNNTPLHLAIIGGHTRIAELIIGQLKGSPIDAMDNDGNSPLHLAAQRDYSDLVIQLLSGGASYSAVNKNGQRPYSLAPYCSSTYFTFRNRGIYS